MADLNTSSRDVGGTRQIGGIILAGGQSSRLGQDKALIDVEGELLIERVIMRLRQVVAEIVLVTDRPERLAFLGLPMTRDLYPGIGTLGGLHAGLAALHAKYAVAVGCDMPFLNPDLLRYLVSLRDTYDVVMPQLGKYYEPLHAVYGTHCLPLIERTIQAGERRIMHALRGARVRYVQDAQIRAYDPHLRSFFNVNRPEDLERMRTLLDAGHAQRPA
jgi:molybdopterin-guanine dinucleotide biosynthesis protein A